LGDRLGYKQITDWYRTSQSDFQKYGGKGFLSLYNNSVAKSLEAVYPQHVWISWKFPSPLGFWDDPNNRKEFFDWLGTHPGFTTLEGWYNVTKRNIVENGGEGLLKYYYDDSPSKAVLSIYSQHNWMLWRFHLPPRGYWRSLSTDKLEMNRLFDWLSEKLAIKSLDDWYRISLDQLRKLVPFAGLLSRQTVAQVVKSVFPEYPWDMDRLYAGSGQERASQRALAVAMRELFPEFGE